MSLRERYDRVRGHTTLLNYVHVPPGNLIATNPEGHVVDALTPERAAFLAALVNAYADGTLVERAEVEELIAAAISLHDASLTQNEGAKSRARYAFTDALARWEAKP